MPKELKFISEFKDLPLEEKPRERILKYGPQALAPWELVALILRTGERHKGGYTEDIEKLSKRLIADAGLKGLFTQKNVESIVENFGIQPVHAGVIASISEIANRLHGKFDIFDATEPSKILEKFKHLQKAKQEQCHVLHIDKDCKCSFSEIVAMGTTDSMRVYPTDVLRTPIWLGTKRIIIVHNHPDHCEASQEDIDWTMSLVEGAWKLHNIKIADHIIISKDGYFSFAEKNLLPN